VSVRRVGKRWQVRVRIGSGQRVERTLPRTATHADARALETQILRAQVDAAIGRPLMGSRWGKLQERRFDLPAQHQTRKNSTPSPDPSAQFVASGIPILCQQPAA